jgi:hypothetical protein
MQRRLMVVLFHLLSLFLKMLGRVFFVTNFCCAIDVTVSCFFSAAKFESPHRLSLSNWKESWDHTTLARPNNWSSTGLGLFPMGANFGMPNGILYIKRPHRSRWTADKLERNIFSSATSPKIKPNLKEGSHATPLSP